MRKFGFTLAAAAAFLCLFLPSPQLHAQELQMLEALSHGKEEGLLPPWLTLDDDFAMKWEGARLYGCFRDRTTGGRWTSWSPVLAPQRYMVEGVWKFSTPTPTTYADQRVCWPDLPVTPPAPAVPAAIGQPVYRGIVHLKAAAPPYWRTDSPLDWASMNKDFVAGTTTTGQACGARLIASRPTGNTDPKVAWHLMPTGLTLCRTP